MRLCHFNEGLDHRCRQRFLQQGHPKVIDPHPAAVRLQANPAFGITVRPKRLDNQLIVNPLLNLVSVSLDRIMQRYTFGQRLRIGASLHYIPLIGRRPLGEFHTIGSGRIFAHRHLVIRIIALLDPEHHRIPARGIQRVRVGDITFNHIVAKQA
ncbi:hypothetical protein D3C74_384220 [compost metagenome]